MIKHAVNSIAFIMNTDFFLQVWLLVALLRISTMLWRTPLYLVQTIRGVQLRVTVISYSLRVSKKCHIVVRIGYGRLSYHHASVSYFPLMSPINFKLLLPGIYYFVTVVVLNLCHR